MYKYKSELAWLKLQLNSHYGTTVISTSATMKRVSEIKKKLKKIEQRKNKILTLTNHKIIQSEEYKDYLRGLAYLRDNKKC